MLILLDGANNLSRRITVISANQFRTIIGNSIKAFGATSCPDEIQTHTATAPVDPSLAASCAATASPSASLSAPVSVIEHATRAPVDVYTAPARMIEHVAPAPVIEYIAPSPAVSCPSVQEIPKVQVVERIQEPNVDPIVETTENIEEILVVQEQAIVQEILDVVVPLPPVEEFTEPVHQVHQERIVTGEVMHNIIGNSAVQEQVIVQELPPIAEQTQETIDVASSITEMLGVLCATPVGPQIGDVGFDCGSAWCSLCNIVRSHPYRWEIVAYPRPDQGSLLLGKTRTIRVGPMDTSQRLHRRARCQAQETLNVDGVRDDIWEGA